MTRHARAVGRVIRSGDSSVVRAESTFACESGSPMDGGDSIFCLCSREIRPLHARRFFAAIDEEGVYTAILIDVDGPNI